METSVASFAFRDDLQRNWIRAHPFQERGCVADQPQQCAIKNHAPFFSEAACCG